MAVKAGKVITLGNGFLVERAQNVGAPNLNIPLEKIKETGNELNVSTERDVPDLSFDIESLDGTIDTEAMICNVDPLTLSDGDVLTFAQAQPLDVVSPYKAAGTSKTSDGGIIWPHLTLTSATWRFGVGTQGATQTFSFSGDAQYQGKKTPYRQTYAGDGVEDTFVFTNTAVKTVEDGDDLYALSVCVYLADGTYLRLFNGDDYTSTSAGFVLVDPTVAPSGSVIAACYFSATTANFAQTIHSTPSVKPGKIKGKNIFLYVAVAPHRSFNAGTTNADATLTAAGGAFTSADVGAKVVGTGIPAGTTILSVTNSTTVEMSANATATAASVVTELSPPLVRWKGVQSVEVNWRVTLDKDQELGNPHNVASDYDTPDLSGTITIRPGSNDALFDKIAQVTGADPNEITNVLAQNTLELQIRLENPRTGDIIKTLKIDDAQILPPAAQARAGQKLENQFSWSSEAGELEIVKGAPV